MSEKKVSMIGSSRKFAFLSASVPIVLLLLSSALHARSPGETVKNTAHGFAFKVPKDWVSIPVDPMDTLTLHKHQAEKADKAKKRFGVTLNASLSLLFIPVPGAATEEMGNQGEDDQDKDDAEEEDKDSPPKPPPIKNYEDFIERVLERQLKAKQKSPPRAKNVNDFTTTFHDMEGALPGSGMPIRIRAAVYSTSNGEFVMQCFCLDEHYSNRHRRDIEASFHSFRRIEKENDEEKNGSYAELSDNEKYIQDQIDKLSSGWYHFWSSNNNYIIFSNAERSFAKEIARQLEGIHECYVDLFPDEPRIKWIPIVRVCKTRDEYHGYGGPSGSAGYWSDLTKEFVFYNDIAHGPKNTYLVLKHEAFHHFMHFYLGCRPSTWFDEGMAEYFAGGEFVGKRVRIKQNSWRRGDIQQALVADKTVKLRFFLKMTKREYYAKAGLCYAQGWSFIYFLLEGRKQGGRVKKEWTKIPFEYLKNLQDAFEEVEKANPDDVADKNEVNSDLSPPAVAIAMDRTFGSWTDKDWEELEEAWKDFAK